MKTNGKPQRIHERKRLRLDDHLWALFVEACGSKCCACGRADLPLERGHIQRHADGCVMELENLMPLCRPCNGRNSKGFNMSDTRPPDWRDTFVKLLLKELHLKITFWKVGTPSPENRKVDTPSTSTDVLENKSLITLDQLIFEPDSVLYTTLRGTDLAQLAASVKPRLPDVLATVNELIAKGAAHWVPINLPREKCLDKLKRLAAQRGSKTFLSAGKELLRREAWFDGNGKTVFRLDRDPWQTFVDNFDMYAKWAAERAELERKNYVAEQTRQQKAAIEQIERDHKARWDKYLLALTLDWPTMTDADRAFVEAVQPEPNDECLARIDDMLERYHEYKRTTRKYKLQKAIERLGKMVLHGELKLTREQCDEFVKLRRLVEQASDNGAELEGYLERLRAATTPVQQPEPEPEPEAEEDLDWLGKQE